MKKCSKLTTGALIFTGIGVASWMMYKKNPHIICDIKMKVKDMAFDLADRLEDMNMEME